MSKYAFFFDIDGTLIAKDDFAIAKSTQYSLRSLKQQGHKLFVCTGRDIRMVKHLEVEDLVAWDGKVCCNGQMVYNHNDQIISQLFLDISDVRTIIARVIEDENVTYMLVCNGYGLAPLGINNHMRQSLVDLNESLDLEIRAYNESSDKVQMMLIFANNKEYDYQPLIMGCQVEAIIGLYSYADINYKAINKAYGVTNTLQCLGLCDYKIIFFGDGTNDIEALQLADIGVAMKESNERVCASANYVTAGVKEDGIYHALLHLGFIEAK